MSLQTNRLALTVIFMELVWNIVPLLLSNGLIIVLRLNVAARIGPYVQTLTAVDGFLSALIYSATLRPRPGRAGHQPRGQGQGAALEQGAAASADELADGARADGRSSRASQLRRMLARRHGSCNSTTLI